MNVADAPKADGSVAPRHYAFLVFVTLLNVMNFVDRQLLASFANFIVPDLGLSNTEFGWLTGFAFILFYSGMGLLAGSLADLVHRPRLVAAGLALWSTLTAASGAARGFLSLAAPRALIGVGESVLTPSSLSMLADRFPASRLGFASGFYYMGVPLGVGASLLVAGYLGPALGWRNCFYLLGALGLLLSIAMLFVRETRPVKKLRETHSGDTRSLASNLRTLRTALARSPALSLTICGGVATHFVLGAAAFDQLWLVGERGFERAEIARLSGWVGMAGGVLGNLAGGLGADWWQRRTGSGRPLFLFWTLLALAPLGIVYRLAPPDSPWFWLGLFSGFVQLGVLYGPTFATVQELAPAEIRATVVAFYILALNFVGLGVGITGGGYLVDALIARGVAEPYTWTLLGFGVLSLLSIPFFYAAGRRMSG